MTVGAGLARESQMPGRDLPGRTIVVLGGTGGLGHAVTGRFRDDGASVLVADARPPSHERRHEGVEYVTVDVRDEASVAAVFAMSPPPQAVVNLLGGGHPPPGRARPGGPRLRPPRRARPGGPPAAPHPPRPRPGLRGLRRRHPRLRRGHPGLRPGLAGLPGSRPSVSPGAGGGILGRSLSWTVTPVRRGVTVHDLCARVRRELSSWRTGGRCGVPRPGAAPGPSGARPCARAAWPGGAPAACVRNAAAPPRVVCCDFAR